MRATLGFILLILAGPAAADSVDVLLGTWVSADGKAKQEFVREFDRHWVNTRMWFKLEDTWKLVGNGALYRRPGKPVWHGAVRTKDMDGVMLFEVVLEPTGDGKFLAKNTAYMDTGMHFNTEEEWTLDGKGGFQFVIYQFENEERKLFMQGEWIRVAGET